MKQCDIEAIQKFDTTRHIYLTVKRIKTDHKTYLVAEKKNWFGRCFMKLGCSNASMKKVVQYLEKNNVDLLEQSLKTKLKVKIIDKWAKNHAISQSIREFLTVNPPEKELPAIPDLTKSAFDTLSETQLNIFNFAADNHTEEWDEMDEAQRLKLGLTVNHDKARSRWYLNASISYLIPLLNENRSAEEQTELDEHISFIVQEVDSTLKNEFMKLLGSRLKLIEKEIQIKGKAVSYITVDDILGPISFTSLKIKLMDENKLKSLTVNDIQAFSPSELDYLSKTLLERHWPADWSHFTFIKELNALDKDALQRALQKLSFVFIVFLEHKRIEEIDPVHLTNEFFIFIHKSKHRVCSDETLKALRFMTKEQIIRCSELGNFKPDTVDLLSAEQIMDLNFTIEENNAQRFNVLVSALSKLIFIETAGAEAIVKQFSLEKINKYLSNQYCDPSLLLCCSEQQFLTYCQSCENIVDMLNKIFSYARRPDVCLHQEFRRMVSWVPKEHFIGKKGLLFSEIISVLTPDQSKSLS